MIGEGERAGDIGRAEPADAIAADLERIAAARAERVGQTPIGAGAGERKADNRGGRDVIVHAAGKAEGACRDIV